ncbi:MAG: hypothetical protein PPFGHCPK_01493 (plasmid) [Spiroplasma endosymbiont of Drosophila atripex]|nr:MAG: hypothetical protein PPFGHCPK_01493 [Spiroplasma endosymbiont of Drosophila atripex]
MSEKQKAYYASYYEANKERKLLIQKVYNQAHKNEIAVKQRKYYLNNKEKFKIKGE